MARLRLGFILLGLGLLTVVLLPFQLVALWTSPQAAAFIPMLWQRAAAALVGLHVRVEGMPATARPLLIVSNHVSWLDIATLGRVLPLSFIAKRDVDGWPVVRWLARLQQSIFVDRARRTATTAANDAIAARLARGDVIVLFAEGTTGDGIAVLPFRSALVGAATAAVAEIGEVVIQPVAIVYTALQGLPIGRLRMADVAWHGDMELAPHLVGLLGVGSIDAVVAFGTPIPLTSGMDRKAVTARAEAEVRRMVRRIRATPRRAGAPAPRDGAILTEAESG